MNYPCELIKDIIPLYCDRIASKESQKAVEEHLMSCTECKQYYESMCSADKLEEVVINRIDARAAESYKNLRKKLMKKYLKLLGIILLIIFAIIFAVYVAVVVYLKVSAKNSLELHTNISEYKEYRASTTLLSQPNAGSYIWPEEITYDMTVDDYLEVYFCPFDPNYYGYLSVTYNDEAYENELDRLSKCSLDDYTIYYGATHFETYDVLAMDASDSGFIYALSTGESNITFVEILFPGYAADLDFTEYIPREYLPENLDVFQGNTTQALHLPQ